MATQMIAPGEAGEILLSREVDGSSQSVAISSKKEESTTAKLFDNSISESSKSGNTDNEEVVYVEIGEQVIRDVHESIDAIERCEPNEQSLYMFICSLNYKCNMRIEGHIAFIG